MWCWCHHWLHHWLQNQNLPKFVFPCGRSVMKFSRICTLCTVQLVHSSLFMGSSINASSSFSLHIISLGMPLFEIWNCSEIFLLFLYLMFGMSKYFDFCHVLGGTVMYLSHYTAVLQFERITKTLFSCQISLIVFPVKLFKQVTAAVWSQVCAQTVVVLGHRYSAGGLHKWHQAVPLQMLCQNCTRGSQR